MFYPTTNCQICGASCKDWGYGPDSQNITTCGNCAAEIHKRSKNGLPPSKVKSDGDCFPIDHAWYADAINWVRSEWQKSQLLQGSKVVVVQPDKKPEADTQEIWIQNIYIYALSPKNKFSKITLPKCCPHCNKDIVIKDPGDSTRNGFLGSGCSHTFSYEQLYSLRLETKEAPMSGTQDFIIENRYIPGKENESNKTTVIKIPLCCPDCNQQIVVSKCGNSQWSDAISSGCQHVAQYQGIYARRVREAETREQMAEEIINLLKDHMYAFGGYLRDKELGVDFKDIDLFFPRLDKDYKSANLYKDPHSLVLDKLTKAGYSVTTIATSSNVYVHEHGVRLSKQAYSIKDKSGKQINIDVVKTNAKSYESFSDNPFISLDADVNSLYRKKDGKLAAANMYDVETIRSNIKKKLFNVPIGASIRGERLQKLLEKGFSMAGLPDQEQPAVELEVEIAGQKLRFNPEGISLFQEALAGVIQKEKEKAKAEGMEKSKLKVGDRVLLNIKDDEEIEYDVEATVISNDEDNGLLFCLDDYFETDAGNYSAFDVPYGLNDVVENLGLSRYNTCWQLEESEDEGTLTKVVKKLPRKPIEDTSAGSDVEDIEEEEQMKPVNERGEEMGFWELCKSEAAEGGLEVLATQITDGIQFGVLQLLKDKGEFNDGELAVVKKLFASKGGHAVLSWALGMGLLHAHVPGFTDLPGVEDLAKKFRVGGFREIGNEGANLVKEYFGPVLMSTMAKLPEIAEQAAAVKKSASKPRVATPELNTRVASDPQVEVGEEEEVDLSELAQRTGSVR